MNTDHYSYQQQRVILPPIQSLVDKIDGVNGIRLPPLVPRSCEVLDGSTVSYTRSIRAIFDRSFMDSNRSIPYMYPPPPQSKDVSLYGTSYHNKVPTATNYFHPVPPQNQPPAALGSSPPRILSTPSRYEYPLSRVSTPVTNAVNYSTTTTPKPSSVLQPPPLTQPVFKTETPTSGSNYKFSLRLTPSKTTSVKKNTILKKNSKLHSLTTVAMALATQGNTFALTPESLMTDEASRRNSDESNALKLAKKASKVSFDDQNRSLPVTIPKVLNREFVQVVQQNSNSNGNQRPTTSDSAVASSGTDGEAHDNGGSARSTIRKRKVKPGKVSKSGKNRNIYGQCLHCGRDETPEWRNGPRGKATLCNACGLFFKKLKRHFGNESVAIQYMQHRCLVNSEDRTMPRQNE